MEEDTSLVCRKAPHQYGGRHFISMEEDTLLVCRKAPHQYGGRHFISMEEDTLLVCRNAFYLDSLNINDLPRPT